MSPNGGPFDQFKKLMCNALLRRLSKKIDKMMFRGRERGEGNPFSPGEMKEMIESESLTIAVFKRSLKAAKERKGK